MSDMFEQPLMTPEEHHAVELSAGLWNYISEHVVADGPTRDADLREIMAHVHGVQRAIMGQAAARAYPDQYRLLGGKIASEMNQLVMPFQKKSGDRRTDDCAVNGDTCYHDEINSETGNRRTDAVRHLGLAFGHNTACGLVMEGLSFSSQFDLVTCADCKEAMR